MSGCCGEKEDIHITFFHLASWSLTINFSHLKKNFSLFKMTSRGSHYLVLKRVPDNPVFTLPMCIVYLSG